MTSEFTFTGRRFSEADDWGQSNPSITEEMTLKRILGALDQGRLLLVEHRFYRAASAPDWTVFSDYDLFKEYLKERCHAGDAIHVFDITDSIQDGKQLVYGKCPNEKGETPAKGAY